MEIERKLRETRLNIVKKVSAKTVTGNIRINPKNYNHAFINDPEGGLDIYIEGLESRRTAMDGDIVKVAINDHSQWKLNHNLIVDRWSDWSKHLMPIIETIETADRVSHTSDLSEGDNQESESPNDLDNIPQSPRRKKSSRRVKRDTTTIKTCKERRITVFNLPSNLPSGISKLQVEHIFDLPISTSCIQKTGSVIEIIKRNHSCIAGGFLRQYSSEFALFSPNDSRVPRMLIPISECPIDFATQFDRYKNVLFVAQMENWKPGHKYATGKLLKVVGDCNDVQSRMETLLLEHEIYDTDFPQDAYDELDYLNKIPPNWVKKHSIGRRDLTKECIFTIDPKTARDLDDAVSVKQIAEQIYEVGVHIADVSYFVKELSAVDFYARQRTTSVYLVDRVIPMLPRILCEQMCSLNPNEPKLTYSVIWKMDKFGRIIDEWFGRTVIKSCVKLAYEEAQDLIENSHDISWIEEGKNMPKLYGYDWKRIQKSVALLNKIAVNMRTKRYQGGALRIEQVKLKFQLDPETGFPTGFEFEQRKNANFLIEEFMLRANMSVAQRIYKKSKKIAFLRRHPPSSAFLLKEVKEFCDAKGYPLDITSAGSLQKSLNAITDPTIAKVVSFMLLRAMKNAEYICTGAMPSDELGFSHFALNVPFYTHFTSPIRRYADIIVHRQLSIALGYDKSTHEDIDSLARIAQECNKRKISSKLISDTSQRLYFNIFVQKAGFCELLACVTRIYDQSFDVILADYDRAGRVHMNDIKPHLESMKFESHSGFKRLVLQWKPPPNIVSNDDRKVKKKKNGKKLRKVEPVVEESLEKLDSRRSLETGKVYRAKLPVSEARDNLQIIQVFDVIRVIVTPDEKDIMQLKIGLKTPFQQ